MTKHKQNNIKNTTATLLLGSILTHLLYALRTSGCNKKHSKEILPKYLKYLILKNEEIFPLPIPKIKIKKIFVIIQCTVLKCQACIGVYILKIHNNITKASNTVKITVSILFFKSFSLNFYK